MQLGKKELRAFKPIDKELLNNVVNNLSKEEGKAENSILKNKIYYCYSILQKMKDSEDSWFSSCPFNYHYLLDSFEKLLRRYINENELHLDDILLISIRFYKEYILYNHRMGKTVNEDINFRINKIFYHEIIELDILRKKKITQELTEDEEQKLSSLEDINYDIEYIKTELASDIINFYLGDRSYKSFLNYENNVKIADEKNDSLKQFLRSSEEETKRIADILEKQQITGTFVRLEKAFHSLLRKKRKEEESLISSMVILGLLVVFTPLFAYASQDEISLKSLPILGVELLLIYFFRIILKQYYLVRSQIIQLEFRYSMCEFIGGYAEYSKKLKDDNNNSLLEKFEYLVFSDLLSNSDNIPSAFDGLKEITSFIDINKIKGK